MPARKFSRPSRSDRRFSRRRGLAAVGLLGTVTFSVSVAVPAGASAQAHRVSAARLARFDRVHPGAAKRLRETGQKLVSLTPTPDHHGTWALGSAGSVFTFGDARWFGSPFAAHIGGTYDRFTATADGLGYTVTATSGASYRYGDAQPTAGSNNPPPTSPPSTSPPTTTPPTTTPPTTAPPTTAPPTTAPAPPPPPSGLSYGLFSHLLPSSNPTSDSSQLVYDFVTDYQDNYGQVGVNSEPVMVVSASQPRVSVTPASGCNDFTPEAGSTMPIPANTPLNDTSDNPVIIDQPSSHTEWEVWQAAKQTDGHWTACWAGKLDTSTSNGVFPYPYGLAASGISYLATDITEADVASGSINHAIAVQMPSCTAPAIAPADRTDCSPHPGQPAYGTYYRFPAGMAVPSGLTPFGQMVFKAVRDYGMVLTDYAGAVMLVAESPSDWAAEGHTGTDPITASWQGDAEWQVVADLPWNQLEVVPSP